MPKVSRQCHTINRLCNWPVEDQREVTAKRRSVYDSMTSTSMGASGRCRLPAAADNPCPPDDTNALGYSRSEEHTSELQSQSNIVCRLLLEKKNTKPPT